MANDIRLVTAPEDYNPRKGVKVFLAGGIQKCDEWQARVARNLASSRYWGDGKVTLYNPRQSAFDMSDPRAGEKQIRWEYDYLNKMDVFSMFFYGPTESDQPICFYELGRYIEVMKRRFPRDWWLRIVVTAMRGFRRLEDVVIQTRLATDDRVEPNVYDSLQEALDGHSWWTGVAIHNALSAMEVQQ